MKYKIKKGQYFYGYLRGAYRIYKADADSEDIRKVTPRKIMEVMNEYAEAAFEREERIVRDLEKAQAERERIAHEQSAMTFEQYKKAKGYGDEITNPLDIIK